MSGERSVIDRHGVQQLLDALWRRGYRVVGPTIRDGAILYDDVRVIADFPVGWTDEQDGGAYRLKKREDEALFGYAVGPHSWKRLLHPPVLRLWTATREGKGFRVDEAMNEPATFAFFGVRSCEIQAMAIQDTIFLNGPSADPAYAQRREGAFIVAVNCMEAGGTCFCVSMNTGPNVSSGYDIAVTEVVDANRHDFVVAIGTESGADVFRDVPHRPALASDIDAAERVVEGTAQRMGRSMETTDIKELLYRNYEHSRWEDVARRCLACGNCTMVCPTCFCTTVEDTTDLAGEHAERRRKWDSCFTTDFSYIHGGPVRSSISSRYRQWITHKLASWIDQFGTSGCVGCGRCITWCPVGIDITEEVRAIRESEA